MLWVNEGISIILVLRPSKVLAGVLLVMAMPSWRISPPNAASLAIKFKASSRVTTVVGVRQPSA